MPVQKICQYCGKKYDASGQCDCVYRQRAVQRFRQTADAGRSPLSRKFYKNKKWLACRNNVFVRAAGLDEFICWFDRLQRSGSLDAVFDRGSMTDRMILTGLRSMAGRGVLDAFSRGRERLLAHHIIPREEAPDLAYTMDNLVGVTVDTHNWIHQLYGRNAALKTRLQQLLRLAVGVNSTK